MTNNGVDPHRGDPRYGTWIGKGQWLPHGERPPQTMVIDTYEPSPDRQAYDQTMRGRYGSPGQ